MEEKYKQITDIISELAANNPYITAEQVVRAKSMYNGDQRPLEEIKKELEAYSTAIAEQGKQNEHPSIEAQPDLEMVDAVATPNVQPTEAPEPEYVTLPTEQQREELQDMIDNAMSAEQAPITYKYDQADKDYDKPKQYVKAADESHLNQSNEGGYGNLGALLTLSIMFSIMTIVMAIFTILAN